MALDRASSAQVLDLLFDDDTGVLSKEFDLDGKTPVETLSFGDLDLLSTDLLDLMQTGSTAEDVFDGFPLQSPPASEPSAKKQKVYTDHDYFAHLSPGQNSDSGVSLNSFEQEDSFLPSMAGTLTDDNRLANMKQRQFLASSPDHSNSMSPLSDSTSDSNPLGLEDFDFSSCMGLGDFGSGETMALDTINSSALSGSKDTQVSIDFDLVKVGQSGSKPLVSGGVQQQVQTIRTSSGQQAVILVDASTRQPIKIHSVLTRAPSDSDSLPFTMRDVDEELAYGLDDNGFPDLRLTDEEKELLAREGVSLPANMPLTKEEERVLKAVRRKIRNKISAKESRKRKQGYVDGLERRVKICTQENQHLHKKVDTLTKENTTLMTQLSKLKAMVSTGGKGHAQASTCVMVLLLSFALLVIPNISPFTSSGPDTLAAEGGVRGKSRSLLGKDEPPPIKVASVFSDEVGSSDSDPYGVTSKPGLPWDGKTPAAYSSVRKLPRADEGEGEEEEEGGEGLVVDMEGNETEEAEAIAGDFSEGEFQENVVFRSEVGNEDFSESDGRFQKDDVFRSEEAGTEEITQPSPAKRAKQEFVAEDNP